MKKLVKSSSSVEPQALFENSFHYGPKFLERLVGRKLLNDPRTAVVELVANAWDAGAKSVEITWPTSENRQFSIVDTGHGVTQSEFKNRWRTLAYDRLSEQGNMVKVVGEADDVERQVYGRNGVGRFAAFCFGELYTVSTCKNGKMIQYSVSLQSNKTRPFGILKLAKPVVCKTSGTRISVDLPRPFQLTFADIASELAMRFLADPRFTITVNGSKVKLDSISKNNLYSKSLTLSKGQITVTVIDTAAIDRTSHRHGIAFHVRNRLVGDVTWRHTGLDDPIDGRSVAGKRLLFIVQADFLQEAEAINPDWTGFDGTNESYKEVVAAIEPLVNSQAFSLNDSMHEEDFREAQRESMESLQRLEIKKVGK